MARFMVAEISAGSRFQPSGCSCRSASFTRPRGRTSSSGLSPQPHEVPFGVPRRGDSQAALRTSRACDSATMSLDLIQSGVNIVDIYERKNAGLGWGRLADDEVSDHVARRVRERGLVAVASGAPAEHRLIEISRAGRDAAWDV